MKQKISALYLIHSINGFASALISVFIPIFLYANGFSLQQYALYAALVSFEVLLFFIVAAWMVPRLGLRGVFVFHLPFLFIYLLLLHFLPQHNWLFYWLTVFSSLYLAFYWLPLHLFFTKHSSTTKIGTGVGKLFSFPQMASLFAPLIGGLVIAKFGFLALNYFAALIFLTSAMPMMWLENQRFNYKINLGNFFRLFKRHFRYSLAEIFNNIIGEGEYLIIPFYLYLLFKNEIAIGAIGTFVGLGSVVFTFFVGKLTDQVDKKKLMRVGATMLILMWGGRFISSTQEQFYFWSVLSGFFAVLINIPFNAMVYNLAKEGKGDEQSVEFIIYREILVTIGRLIFYAAFYLLAFNFHWLFILPPLAYLLFYFIYK
jgi:MFS family permease